MREVWSDRLEQDLHATELMELDLSLSRVRQDCNEDITTDEFVVINNFVFDFEVGHNAVGEIVENFGLVDDRIN